MTVTDAQIRVDFAVSAQLRLLGRPALRVGKVWIAPDRKLLGVLTLCALEGGVARSRAAALLWGDADEERARQSLRQALTRLQSGVMETGDGLRLLAKTDIVEFQNAVSSGATLQVAWLSGALLEGLDFDDCPEFADWLTVERERLQLLRLEGLNAASDRLETRGEFAPALELARRAVILEPLSEFHHCRVMRLSEAMGDRAAAVAAFEECRRVLRAELNLEPSLETRRLAVLVARGVRLPSIAETVRVEAPPRLTDAHVEVRALVEAARVLDSVGRGDTAFETLHAACTVLAEIEATGRLEALVMQLQARAVTAEQRALAAQAGAWLHYQRGDFQAAETSARRGLGFAPSAALQSALSTEIAAALLRQDKTLEALETQRAAVDSLEPGSLPYATALSELALSLAHADQYVEAERAYLEADALLEHWNAVRQRITVLHNLAMTLKHQGRAAAALEPLGIAARLLAELPGLVDDERYGFANRAEVRLQLGQVTEALSDLERAEQLSLTHKLPCSFVHLRRAQVQLVIGDADGAERALLEARRSPGVHARGQGFAALLEARVAALRGLDWDAPLSTAERQLETAGLRAYLARAHLLRARLSDPETGFELAERVIGAAERMGMGGLEISARAVAVHHAATLGRNANTHREALERLLNTLEPLDLTRAEIKTLLQIQPIEIRLHDPSTLTAEL